MQDADKETLSSKSIEEEDSSEEKALKKPDKLIPCPRCNSMETKFCYYNNYNVNQPRYFCKNCQRYWTAGGTMRNVPVGSGRRKNKSSSVSNYHPVQAGRVEAAAQGMHLPALRTKGTVLTFGSDKPLCDSMVSALNLAENSHNMSRNEFHGPKRRMPAVRNDQSNGTCSTASSVTDKESNSGTDDLANWNNFQGFPPQVPYFQGAPWPYSGFPVSFYPATPYWGCTVANSWNVPWLSSDQSVQNNTPTSPTLGKHSRNENKLDPTQSRRRDTNMQDREGERCVVIPKTLRIHDPNEAAKSSIWSTLGIRNDKIDSSHGTMLFSAFSAKTQHRNHEHDASAVLQANPAALSRSLNFRESTQ